MKTDHYYRGIHYIKYQGLLDDQPLVKLTAYNFKLMRDYIEDLEMQIYELTGKHFDSLKKSAGDYCQAIGQYFEETEEEV